VSFRFLNNICSRRGCSIFCFAKEEEEEEEEEEEVVVVVVVVVVVEALIGAELEEEDLASDEDGRLETSF